jgi:hypothetical protein
MMSSVRSIAVFLCMTLSFNLFAFDALPQTATESSAPAPATNAPVPAQIASSHTIFLSNLGSDAYFPVDSTQVYNDIYKALQSWGHYQLVSSPDQADLIFQLRDVSTVTTYYEGHGANATINNPTFQLTILDSKSMVTLWTITSPVTLAGSKQTLARWLSISETNLVSRIKVVSGQSLSPTETADLTTVPNLHYRRTVLIVTGAAVALVVGGALLGHHLYEDSLASGKASQDAFCNAHGIPLSECAGG